MGVYNTYGNVQLKVGDCSEMRHFKIGDDVDIEDGVYVASEGVVVIADGRFFAEFPHLFTKWGDVIDGEVAIRPHNYIADAVDQAEHNAQLEQRVTAGIIPTRDKVIALIDLQGRRDDFIETYGAGIEEDRTPEKYFDEYTYKEPGIWIDVLNDLQIPVPQLWVDFVDEHS